MPDFHTLLGFKASAILPIFKMGCYKSKCKICRKEIKTNDQLLHMIEEGEHEQKSHYKIFKINKEADLEYHKDIQNALDKKLSKHKVTFTPTKWDGEDYAE